LPDGLGSCWGPSCPDSRTCFIDLIPVGSEATFFSLYSISDKGSSWLGPFVVALLVQVSHTSTCHQQLPLFFPRAHRLSRSARVLSTEAYGQLLTTNSQLQSAFPGLPTQVSGSRLTAFPSCALCVSPLQFTGSLRASFFYILGVMIIPALVLWWKVDHAQGLVDAGRVPDCPDRVEGREVAAEDEFLPPVSHYASCTSDSGNRAVP